MSYKKWEQKKACKVCGGQPQVITNNEFGKKNYSYACECGAATPFSGNKSFAFVFWKKQFAVGHVPEKKTKEQIPGPEVLTTPPSSATTHPSSGTGTMPDPTEEKEQMPTTQKKGRGGARPGSGRKINISGERKIAYGVTFRPDILRIIKSKKNYSHYVEIALLEKFERDGITLEK